MAFSDLIDPHRSPEVTAAKTSNPGTAAESGQAITNDHGDVITENGMTESVITENVVAENVVTENVATENVVPENAATEKRVALPKPDINNITVLTESLPNEPILPWHRFDSPWLEKEEEPTAEAASEEASIPSTDDDCHEQLSLALDGVSSEEVTPEHDQSNGDPLNAHQIQ